MEYNGKTIKVALPEWEQKDVLLSAIQRILKEEQSDRLIYTIPRTYFSEGKFAFLTKQQAADLRKLLEVEFEALEAED